MPSAIWSGAISFGLVTIPIKVVSATESHSISFHQYHLRDMGRIRYRKVCELDDRVLTDDEIGKGYEIAKDTVVPVTDEELAAMPLPTAKAIEIVAFVDRGEIDPIQLADSYYLAADGKVADKPYKLLRLALGRSDKVAIAKFALRGRERLGVLGLRETALVLHTMKWPDEVRDPGLVDVPQADLSEDEVARAVALMDSMTTDELGDYHDEYREAVASLIEAKRDGRELPKAKEPAGGGGQVVDLMAALEKSVQDARRSRGEDAETAGGSGRTRGSGGSGSAGDAAVHVMPEKKKPAKKTARKTPAEKAAVKRTTAKTAASKRSTAKRTAGRRETGDTAGEGTAAKKATGTQRRRSAS